MAKPLRVTLDLLSYEGTLTNDPQDSIQAKRRVEEANVSEVSRQLVDIAPETDLEIAIPSNDCDYICIFSDRSLSLTLNDSEDVILLTPKVPGTKCPVFFLRGQATKVILSNNNEAVAKVDVVAVKV